MNKLSTIYNVMKNMKELEKVAGEFEVNVKKEDETVAQFNKTFDKDKTGKTAKSACKFKISYGDDSLEHQSTTTISGDELRHFGRGFGHRRMMKKMMMMDHGDEIGEFPRKHKVGRFMLMIDLLNKAELEKLDGGNKKLSIDLADIESNEEFKKMIMHKIKYRHSMKHHMGHHHKSGHFRGMGCGKMNDDEIETMKKKLDCLGIFDEDMEVNGLKAEILINDKDYIENVEINIEMSNNEKKEVKFALKGKVNGVN
ncbi:hypothetical protein R9X47_08150 [Wukongibacter baidiensis]|uniref:hypothetical protein n=1 Tax=Wukongibacter baidiensis TaxID=1723361 RepID=UPI003D7F1E4B